MVQYWLSPFGLTNILDVTQKFIKRASEMEKGVWLSQQVEWLSVPPLTKVWVFLSLVLHPCAL